MTDYAHYVHPDRPSWPFDVSPTEYFLDAPRTEQRLSINMRRRGFGLGDRVWIYEGNPVGRFVGYGEVVSPLEFSGQDGSERIWTYGIQFDWAISRRLASMTDQPEIIESPLRRSPYLLNATEVRGLRKLAPTAGISDGPGAAGRLRHGIALSARQGEFAFRDELLRAYDSRCAITGSSETSLLQAAYIADFDSIHRNRLENGLLLRADVHNLFDAGLLWIDTKRVVRVHPSLTEKIYRDLDGVKLAAPQRGYAKPAAALLTEHRKGRRV